MSRFGYSDGCEQWSFSVVQKGFQMKIHVTAEDIGLNALIRTAAKGIGQ